jgi:glucokinase
VGVDLGGTHMRLALYQGLTAPGQGDSSPPPGAAPPVVPVLRKRELVGDARAPDAVAKRLAELVAELIREAGVHDADVAVGVGIAAMLRGYDGMVANAPNLGWRNVAFGPLLHAELDRVLPSFGSPSGSPSGSPRSGRLHLYNDVNAITYGEYAVGAAVGATDVLGVFVGTGIGGGLVAGGRLIAGTSNCAGEIGHFKVVFGDGAPLCGCGLRGCVEAFVGGVHLQQRLRKDLARGVKSAAARLAGDPSQAHPGHLDMAAAEGDAYALELYAELAPLLAITLGNAVSLLNPGRLVLGGGMLSRMPVFREHVLTALELAANRALLDPLTVVEPLLGDDAGLLGGALLASAGV